MDLHQANYIFLHSLRTKIGVIGVFFLLTSCISLEAQKTNIETLTIADGLSQGMIYDIEQTDDGFLWFATKDGLNRYDGYDFEVYTNDPFNPYSIAGNEITSLFEDSRGNLWITLMGRGCDVLEHHSGRFLHFPAYPEIPGILSVTSIEESPDSTIWIGTQKGLLKLHWKKNKINTIIDSDLSIYASVELVNRGHQPGKEAINSIIANPDGTLVVSILNDAIYSFNPDQGQYTFLGKENNYKPGNIFGKSASGRVWFLNVTDQNGVMVFERGKIRKIENWKNLPYPAVSLLNDSQGNILWSTRIGNETSIYSMPETEALQTDAERNPELMVKLNMECASMEIDHSSNLWIGTSGYGLHKIKLFQQPFQHYLKGYSVRRVLSTDDILLWVGGSNDPWQLNPSSDRLMPIPRLPSDVYEFYKTKSGGAYIIAGNNKHYFLKDANDALPPSRHVEFPAHEYSPLTEDASGNIWIGGLDAQLMRFQPSSGNITFLDLSGQLKKGATVFALYVDEKQNLWVGTTNGMVQIHLQDLVFSDGLADMVISKARVYQTDSYNPFSLRYNFVTSFCDDPHHPDRFLWVSTKGGGISMLDKTTRLFRHFHTQNSGLSNDVVYGIIPDDNGNLWMSTNRGLSRMTCLPAFYENTFASSSTDVMNKGIVFQNFRESDGLQSDEFNTSAYYRLPDGRLLFGGVNGLTSFYPSDIKDRESDSPVRITGLKINNLAVDYFKEKSPLSRPIYLSEQITLKHNQNLVTLDFALMDFVTPTENRFRYRLQGVDPDWVNAGTNHTANYAQLRSGKYLFEVQGNIGYGKWSTPATLRITVLPPWWASWWAYAIYFLLLSAAVYGIIYFFKKRLRLQHELKLKFEEANKLKELDTFKSHVYTNLTHEFRTPLTVILGMTNQLESGAWQAEIPDKDKGKVSGALRLIENNGKNLLRLINQLLDLSRLESKSFKLQYRQSDIVPYLRYVTESFQSYANGQNLSLRFFSGVESLLMDFDSEQIKQVVTNLISNALKFTPSGGDIHVKLMETQGTLGLVVTDTGIGISPENKPFIFDRFYQVDSATTRVAQGTGIGLAHTQELVKIMGGRITVESEIGKGTSIYVHLPITNNAPIVTQHAHIPDNGLSWAIGHSITDEPITSSVLDSSLPQLLIIEDNPDVVIYLKTCLENDYQIIVAYNGKIGIDRAFELIPDFIISDVMMPEKDGYQVCDTLKNDERTSHIPIILLTAKADAASRLAGFRRGADAYLAKPFNVEELLLQIRVLLDNRRRMASYFSKRLLVEQVTPIHDNLIAEDLAIEDTFITKVKGIIEANYMDENFSLPQLCLEIGMSRSQLFRKLKAVMDASPSDMIRSYRLTRARVLLQNGDLTVAEVTYQVGFKDPSYFSKIFFEEFGILPGSIAK